jgi:hypothetical protein
VSKLEKRLFWSFIFLTFLLHLYLVVTLVFRG